MWRGEEKVEEGRRKGCGGAVTLQTKALQCRREEELESKEGQRKKGNESSLSLSAGIYPHVAYCSAFNTVSLLEPWERGTKDYFRDYRTHHESSGGYTNVEPTRILALGGPWRGGQLRCNLEREMNETHPSPIRICTAMKSYFHKFMDAKS